MITKLNTFYSANQPAFTARPNITKSGYAVLTGNSVHQVSSLKSVCKEILLRVNNNKKLIAAATAALGGIKLTESAISFYTDEKDAIRLSMPRGAQGDLFKMQIIKDGKPENTVILDNFNKMVESYSLNKMRFLKEKNVDKKLIDAFVEGVYNSVDEPLFQVRMFVRNNSTEPTEPVKKIKAISMPNPVEIKEKKIAKDAEEKKDKKFVPTVEQMKNYSLPELIRQYNAKQKEKINALKAKKIKATNLGEKRLVPLSSLSDAERAKLKLANKSKDPIPAITLEEGAKLDSIVLDAKRETVIIKEKRGRRKTKSKEEKQAVKTTRKGRPTKVANNIKQVPAGRISVDIKSKLEEINKLSTTIFEELKKFSNATTVKIRTAYDGVKTKKNRIIFGDLIISNPQRREYKGHQITAISDGKNNISLNISDLENVISQDLDWNATVLPKMKLLSQDEVDAKFSEEKYNNLIDYAIEHLQGFKSFLEQRGWTKKVAETELVDSSASMKSTVLEKLSDVNKKYKTVIATLKSMSTYKAGKLKKDFGQLVLVKSSSRLEFINPLNDGTNLLYNFSKSRYGEFIFIVKHDGTKNLEEVFVISKDGKLVKNHYHTMGINVILPTNSNQKLKFYSQEELNSNGKEQKLQELLAVLDEKISEFQDFMQNYDFEAKKARKPRTPKVPSAASSNVPNRRIENSVPFDVIKEFLDNTAKELQAKADKLSEMTGFKSILDSVAENLKTKFDEFLNKNKEA